MTREWWHNHQALTYRCQRGQLWLYGDSLHVDSLMAWRWHRYRLTWKLMHALLLLRFHLSGCEHIKIASTFAGLLLLAQFLFERLELHAVANIVQLGLMTGGLHVVDVLERCPLPEEW